MQDELMKKQEELSRLEEEYKEEHQKIQDMARQIIKKIRKVRDTSWLLIDWPELTVPT